MAQLVQALTNRVEYLETITTVGCLHTTMTEDGTCKVRAPQAHGIRIVAE